MEAGAEVKDIAGVAAAVLGEDVFEVGRGEDDARGGGDEELAEQEQQGEQDDDENDADGIEVIPAGEGKGRAAADTFGGHGDVMFHNYVDEGDDDSDDDDDDGGGGGGGGCAKEAFEVTEVEAYDSESDSNSNEK